MRTTSTFNPSKLEPQNSTSRPASDLALRADAEAMAQASDRALKLSRWRKRLREGDAGNFTL